MTHCTIDHRDRQEGLPDIHPHDFRHLRASQLLSEGARLEEVQEILGHLDIGTTRKIYAAFSQAAVKEAFKAYTLKPEEALMKAESEGVVGHQPLESIGGARSSWACAERPRERKDRV